MSYYAQPSYVVLDILLGQLSCYSPNTKATIKKDADPLLKDLISLQCRINELVYNDGRMSRLLEIFGTIPIYYKGAQYNIPVSVWVPENYPVTSPKCYVTPTKDMRIKERHKHVDDHGLVYLPYLSEWQPNKSNLIELVQIMSSAFSDNPPVFRYDPSLDPNHAAHLEVARPVHEVVHVENKSMNEAAARKDKLVADVTKKLKSALSTLYQELTQDIDQLMSQQQTLRNNQNKLTQAQGTIKAEKAYLQTTLENINKRVSEIEKWLAVYENQQNNIDLHQLVAPKDTWSRQLLDAVANDHAIDDTIYELNRYLQNNNIDLRTFLKHVRKLARDQFYHRALATQVVEAQQKLSARVSPY